MVRPERLLDPGGPAEGAGEGLEWGGVGWSAITPSIDGWTHGVRAWRPAWGGRKRPRGEISRGDQRGGNHREPVNHSAEMESSELAAATRDWRVSDAKVSPLQMAVATRLPSPGSASITTPRTRA